MDQLSTIVTPLQLGTLPKNNVHSMAVTTQGGKQTIDPLMSYVVEDDMRKDEAVVETSGE